jgi:hypothetical protein
MRGFGLANDDLSKGHLDALGYTAAFVLSTILCCALACIVPTGSIIGRGLLVA